MYTDHLIKGSDWNAVFTRKYSKTMPDDGRWSKQVKEWAKPLMQESDTGKINTLLQIHNGVVDIIAKTL